MSEDRIRQIFEETAALHQTAVAVCSGPVAQAAMVITAALDAGRKILIFGNGGSAADSQHFAAELVGRFQIARRALPALALTTDTSIITSIANDFSYEQIFVRQVQAFGQPGDVAFGLTTSGRSRNVLDALAEAKGRGLRTVALVGTEARQIEAATDVLITVPTANTARVQELHRTILHIICELVELRTQHKG